MIKIQCIMGRNIYSKGYITKICPSKENCLYYTPKYSLLLPQVQ